jgi:hypothetical protein
MMSLYRDGKQLGAYSLHLRVRASVGSEYTCTYRASARRQRVHVYLPISERRSAASTRAHTDQRASVGSEYTCTYRSARAHRQRVYMHLPIHVRPSSESTCALTDTRASVGSKLVPVVTAAGVLENVVPGMAVVVAFPIADVTQRGGVWHVSKT